ncbi:signal peptidase II [Phenylobacterium aquaticum]|uniref:signal peptidase II n=1 Tax=Phenylobacterium aquaticum TaxID=1763816 RepID=UPI0026EA1A21|nr:signal peptidase II [Phenylobacterium aquaticum]
MAEDTPASPAPFATPLGWIAYGLAAATILLDQISKVWILEGLNLPLRITVPVAGPLSLTMVWNRSMSFGLLRGNEDLLRWGLTAFSLGVAALLAAWTRKAERPFMGLGLGLVIGGAIGNAIDRVRFGAVVDFIDVTRLGFFPWVFNVADSAITIGVICLLLDSARREPKAS